MPLPDDNTLGAPTEGLGQNVTFSFNADASVPQLSPDNAVQIHAGVVNTGTVGVGNTQTIGVKATPASATLALLGGLADSALRENLKDRKVEAYVSGMQRAMQGEAVTDIAHSQPWYSKIFGDSDVVEGARAYTGNTVAQTTAAAMIDDMPKLRQMDGPSAQKFFVESVKKAMTGDPATDLSIQQGLVRALPSVMRQQAKEHYGWQQEQATAAEDSSFRAQAASLQGKGASLVMDTVTPEEMQQASMEFIRSQVPAAGRDEKNWKQAQTARLVNAAHSGQFHVMNAAKMPADGKDGPSLLDALDPDQRVRVETAIEVGEGRARQSYLPKVADEMADIELRATHPPEGTLPEDLYKRAVLMNDEYQKRTGSDKGIWSPGELTAIAKGAGAAIWTAREKNEVQKAAEAAKQQTQNEKAAAVLRKTDTIIESFQKGGLYQTSSTPDYGNDLIDYTVQPAYRAMPPAEQAAVLVRNRGYVIKPIQVERDSAVEASISGNDAKAIMSNETQKAYEDWKVLHDQAPDVAAAYYPKTGAKLEHFQRLLDYGLTPQQAYPSAFVSPQPKPSVDKKVQAAAIKAVQDSENSLFKPDMHPDTVGYLSRQIEDSAAEWTGVLGDPKAGATRAFQVLKQSGKAEIIGSYAWPAAPDATQQFTPWLTKSYGGRALKAGGQVAMPYDTVGEVFNKALEEFLGGARVNQKDGTVVHVPGITIGQKPEHIVINPLPGKPGEPPSLAIMALDAEGRQYQGVMSGNDTFALAARRKESERNSPLVINHNPLAQAGAKQSANELEQRRQQDELIRQRGY